MSSEVAAATSVRARFARERVVGSLALATSLGACGWMAGGFGAGLGVLLARTLVSPRRASFAAAEVGALLGWAAASGSWERWALAAVGGALLTAARLLRAWRGRLVSSEARTWLLGVGLSISGALDQWVAPAQYSALAWLVACGWLLAVTLALSTERFTPLRADDAAPRSAVARGGVARNAVAAGLATALDFSVFHTLVAVAPAGAATLAGCAVGGVANFLINRLWAFESRAPVSASALRYAWVSAASAAWNAGAVSVALLEPGVSPAAAWAVARCIGFLGWNYPMQRDHVFRHVER